MTFALSTTCPYFFRQYLNGLETGLTTLLYAMAWRLYQVKGLSTSRARMLFGVLCGFLVLARVDAGFFIVVVAGLVLFETRSIKAALEIGVPAFLVSSPWWAYSYFGFGSLMPISGKAVQKFGANPMRWLLMFEAIINVANPYFPFVGIEKPWSIAAKAILTVPIALGCFRIFLNKDHQWRIPLCLLISMFLLSGWYLYTSFAAYFYFRYLAPFCVLSLVVAAQYLERFLERWKTSTYFGFPLSYHVTLRLLLIPLVLMQVRYYRGRFSNPRYLRLLPLIEEYVPRDAELAALESGTLGYLRDKVINIDGKVNPEIAKNRHRLFDYLRERNIEWYCAKSIRGWHPKGDEWKLVVKRQEYHLFRRKKHVAMQ